MSSQVPTTNDVMINSIAFDGHLYSLHPTATNSSRNVGDIYYYQSGVRLVVVSGGYNENAVSSGILAFAVFDLRTDTRVHLGSSRAL